MSLKRIYDVVVTGCVFCLIWLTPANLHAAPRLAHASATISARVLAPVSVAASFLSTAQQGQLRVSHTSQQLFQLQVEECQQHSFSASQPGDRDYPLDGHHLAQNDSSTPPVTIYFN